MKNSINSPETKAPKQLTRKRRLYLLIGILFVLCILLIGLGLSKSDITLSGKGLSSSIMEFKAESAELAKKIRESSEKSINNTAIDSSTVSCLRGKVICLDPGHQASADLTKEPIGPGSSDTKIKDGGGAEGIVSHNSEHVIVLNISLIVKKLLEDTGATVVMTRMENNVRLGNVERANIANQSKSDLFIRIHCDGSTNQMISGTAVLYPAKNKWTGPIYERSKAAAKIIQESLIKECRRKDNGIVERNDITGFNWSKVPVVLVEAAYLSNPEEDKLLNTQEFQQKVAQGILQGIIGYFKSIEQ